jgi:hypothetical protein
MKIGLPKAGGFWLALVTVLGLALVTLAMPATAQGRSPVQPMPGVHSGQPMSGVHSGNAGIPNRDTNPTNFPRRQPVLNVQPCGANLYAYGYNLFAAPSFGNQSCAAPCPNSAMQGTLDDPDMTSWYGYNRSEVAWWSSNPNSNLNPFSSCNGFQGWWTP